MFSQVEPPRFTGCVPELSALCCALSPDTQCHVHGCGAPGSPV